MAIARSGEKRPTRVLALHSSTPAAYSQVIQSTLYNTLSILAAHEERRHSQALMMRPFTQPQPRARDDAEIATDDDSHSGSDEEAAGPSAPNLVAARVPKTLGKGRACAKCRSRKTVRKAPQMATPYSKDFRLIIIYFCFSRASGAMGNNPPARHACVSSASASTPRRSRASDRRSRKRPVRPCHHCVLTDTLLAILTLIAS